MAKANWCVSATMVPSSVTTLCGVMRVTERRRTKANLVVPVRAVAPPRPSTTCAPVTPYSWVRIRWEAKWAAFLTLLSFPCCIAAQQCALPPAECVQGPAYCRALDHFEPRLGVGYDDYPINGETPANQYRSFVRRELIFIVTQASAVVDCQARDWVPGNKKAVGLGDMSERSGAIPGTSVGHPAHPPKTHLHGRDIDIAYYQLSGGDNHLRAVCPHTTTSGKDAFHCTASPNNLDVRRTALFVGTVLTSPRTRVVGVDGKIKPLLLSALREMCKEGTMPEITCQKADRGKLAAETTNGGHGWFYNHHHHFHVSLCPAACGTKRRVTEYLNPGGKRTYGKPSQLAARQITQ